MCPPVAPHFGPASLDLHLNRPVISLIQLHIVAPGPSSWNCGHPIAPHLASARTAPASIKVHEQFELLLLYVCYNTVIVCTTNKKQAVTRVMASQQQLIKRQLIYWKIFYVTQHSNEATENAGPGNCRSWKMTDQIAGFENTRQTILHAAM